MKNILKTLAFVPLLVACDDLFDPAIENNRGLEEIYDEAGFAQGILANGYTSIPTSSWSFNDVATDDAVSNDADNNFRALATGSWTSINNPLNRWQDCKGAIQYLNLFLSECDKVHWAEDQNVAKMFNDRLKGEAYGLRAMYMYYLLQAHGGLTSDGRLMGIPIVLEPETVSSNFNIERSEFTVCVEQIYSDIEKVESLLPLDYTDILSDSDVPTKYATLGVGSSDYNRVFGNLPRLRMTARIAKGIKAQVALLAASPAFNMDGNTTLWAEAAESAASVLDLIGGVSGIDPNGYLWYANKTEIQNLAAGENPKEILWRGGKESSLDLEKSNFPPTLYGEGKINPTQNLVDAFPMANGYPISNASSGYDETNPYANRDPRLDAYIVVNGSKVGSSSQTIMTAFDGGTNDGINSMELSTKTGYYMRKLLRQDVNLNPSAENKQDHYKPRIRYTEIFLIYAEAANEAWGPTGSNGHGYSAYDVIKAIRNRAGVGVDNNDAYLESIKGDKAAMREMIRNERRLELCFEGFRFWDLRRWKLDLTEETKGAYITGSTYNLSYSLGDLGARNYKDYMCYGPIPYEEMLKFDALVQNQGW